MNIDHRINQRAEHAILVENAKTQAAQAERYHRQKQALKTVRNSDGTWRRVPADLHGGGRLTGYDASQQSPEYETVKVDGRWVRVKVS